MSIRILTGDALTMLRDLPDASVHCCVTSPPYYGLRDYGMAGQLGLERTPDEFVAGMIAVFREVRRVLRDDGTLWLNIGDSYNAQPGQRKTTDKAGAKQMTNRGAPGAPSRHVPDLKPKDLIGIPWMLAFALRADGWYLRQEIIWHKPNPMPESVTDRCTKAHESVFLLSKSPRYFYDAEAVAEAANCPEGAGNASGNRYIEAAKTDPKMRTKAGLAEIGARDTRNKRSVWSICTQPYSEAHFATMAPELAETCIKAGCPKDGTVLDPFGGAGTTALCADRLGRNAILIELNPAYVEIARKRLTNDAGMFAEVA